MHFQDYRRRTAGGSSSEDAARECAYPARYRGADPRLRDDVADVPVHEQWIAVGAVIGNLMAAANALGFAGKVPSGARVRDPLVRAVVCNDEETLVGFVYLGTASCPQIAEGG